MTCCARPDRFSPTFAGAISARAETGPSLVTAADVASERVMLGLLERRVPEDGILPEECGMLPGTTVDWTSSASSLH